MQNEKINNGNQGWVKFSRRILELIRSKEINSVYLYAYILLSVNREGRVEVSIRGLAKQTGLSVQNVRTALTILKREGLVTQELTQSLTQQLTQGTSVITICDSDVYGQPKSESQHSDQHSIQHSEQKGFSPTPPFLKNIIQEKINNNNAREKKNFIDEVHNCTYKQMLALQSLGIDPQDLDKFIVIAESIMREWELTNADDWSWRHLINHARVKLRNENGNQRKENNGYTADSSPDAFTRYFAEKEFELRANESTGHVS